MWGLGSLSYTPRTVLCEVFVLQAPCCIMLVCLARFVLYKVGSLFDTPHAMFSGSLSYSPRTALSGDFVLHAQDCIM